MKNSIAFGVCMPAAGIARALHVAAARPAHAAAGWAAVGTAAQRRTAAATDASVDGGFI
jgi:hypothetical protein